MSTTEQITLSPSEALPEAFEYHLEPQAALGPESEVIVDTVKAYKREIGKIALLDAEEEILLAKHIERGLLADVVLDLRNPDKREDTLAGTRATLEAANKQIGRDNEKAAKEDKPQQPFRDVDGAIRRLIAIADDTSKKSLKDATLREWSQSGKFAKDHFTKANLRWAFTLAARYQNQGLELPDLIEEANLGLMHAVEKFDYTAGIKFSTYSAWWIRQAISRGVAESGRAVRIPVHQMEQVNKLKGIQRKLSSELARDPSHEELAKAMGKGATPEKVADLLEISQPVVSLDLPVGDDGNSSSTLAEYVVEDGQESPVEQAVIASMANTLDTSPLLAAVGAREAQIVRWRFGFGTGEPLTFLEIGSLIGVSPSRVRQIYMTTMTKLRSLVESSGEEGTVVSLPAQSAPKPQTRNKRALVKKSA
jgi:RNA polymerase nonessential primary-like sigma factor